MVNVRSCENGTSGLPYNGTLLGKRHIHGCGTCACILPPSGSILVCIPLLGLCRDPARKVREIAERARRPYCCVLNSMSTHDSGALASLSGGWDGHQDTPRPTNNAPGKAGTPGDDHKTSVKWPLQPYLHSKSTFLSQIWGSRAVETVRILLSPVFS